MIKVRQTEKVELTDDDDDGGGGNKRLLSPLSTLSTGLARISPRIDRPSLWTIRGANQNGVCNACYESITLTLTLPVCLLTSPQHTKVSTLR